MDEDPLAVLLQRFLSEFQEELLLFVKIAGIVQPI